MNVDANTWEPLFTWQHAHIASAVNVQFKGIHVYSLGFRDFI